MVRVRRL